MADDDWLPQPGDVNYGIASGRSFEERVEAADEFTSAFGYVVLAFADLERATTHAITRVLSATELEGEAVAAELRFGKKVALLATLVRQNARGLRLGLPGKDSVEHFNQLAADCNLAESRRNVLMHSSWEPGPEDGLVVRFKRTAKQHRGLHSDSGLVDAAMILDVADFISGLAIFTAPPSPGVASDDLFQVTEQLDGRLS